jgi:hypothetical protein
VDAKGKDPHVKGAVSEGGRGARGWQRSTIVFWLGLATPTFSFLLFFLLTLPRKVEQTVHSETRHIKFRCQGIAQKKEYSKT